MDLLPKIRQLSIVDKEARTSKLVDVMNWPQELLVTAVSKNMTEGRKTRIIILKARQLGFSTITEGIQFELAMDYDHFRGQVVTHETKSNEHLLSITQNYFDTYPYAKFYRQANKSANKLRWLPNDSRIGVITAKNLAGGRSNTLHFVHGSEVAFWPDAGTLMSSLGPAIPKTAFSFVILESTANGIGNWFETTWNDAVSGQNDYLPIFIPWQIHDEYTAEHIGIIPVDPKKTPFDEEEERLYRQFMSARMDDECRRILARTLDEDRLDELCKPMTRKEALSRLAWRRWIIRNELAKRKDGTNPVDLFKQEYPDCPRVAFLSTGSNVFPLPFLEQCWQSAGSDVGDVTYRGGRHQFQRAVTGPLTVWKLPTPGEKYIVAGDPTFTVSGDYGCIQVLNRRTWEQVARYRAKVDPAALGKKMCELGWWYNEALLAPEVNKDGSTTIGRILGLDYPNVWQRQVADQQPNYAGSKYGWFTNTRTKVEAVGNLKSLVVDGSLTIHDPLTFSEMKNYVDLGMGQYGNANGEPNDDTVMALAIAVAVNAYESDELIAADSHMRSEMSAMAEEMNEMAARISGGGTIGDDGGDF
jgi:hypothetical protein